MSNFEGSFGAARARLTAGNRRGGVCVFATSCGRWHFYKLAVIRQESQACFATPLSGSRGSPADSAKVQRMYVFNGCSRFGERGRNRTFNLLIKSWLELGTRFQANSLSNQAFAKNQSPHGSTLTR